MKDRMCNLNGIVRTDLIEKVTLSKAAQKVRVSHADIQGTPDSFVQGRKSTPNITDYSN